MESCVELQIATNENEKKTEERGTKRMGRKGRWEADKQMEVPETEPLEMAVTTQLTMPIEELLDKLPTAGTPTLHSTEEEEFLLEFHSSLSYPPESSTSKESPVVVHKVVDNEEMTKTDVEVGDEYPGDHLHIHAELPSRKESPEMLHKPVDAKERPSLKQPMGMTTKISCVVINGEKEWLRYYERMSDDIMWSGEDFDKYHIEEEETPRPTIDQVVVTHDGD